MLAGLQKKDPEGVVFLYGALLDMQFDRTDGTFSFFSTEGSLRVFAIYAGLGILPGKLAAEYRF